MYLKVIWIVCEPWCPLVCNTWLCQLCQVMSCCGAQFDWCSWMGAGSSWHCNNPGKLKRQFSVSAPEKPGTLCISKPAEISGLSSLNVHQQHAGNLCVLIAGYRGHCPALPDAELCFTPCSASYIFLSRSWGWEWQPCPETGRLHSKQFASFCCGGIFQHLAVYLRGN